MWVLPVRPKFEGVQIPEPLNDEALNHLTKPTDAMVKRPPTGNLGCW